MTALRISRKGARRCGRISNKDQKHMRDLIHLNPGAVFR
jgi:hypothetical protein